MWEQLQHWDVELFVYLNSLGIEKYDRFWIFVTQVENWIPLYVLFFVFYFVAYKPRKAIISCASLIATFLITIGTTNLVKGLVLRLRPNNEPSLLELIRILETPTNYSFFSGHASTSFAVTVFVVLSLRFRFRWIWLVFIWPLLFCLSRVYVGVHYPSDLLVGALVGTAIAFLCYLLYKKIWRNEAQKTTLHESE